MAGRLPDTRRIRVVTARQEADKERVETWRAEQECHVGITGLHPTLDSPIYFGPGEEVPHLGSGAAHRQASREPAGRGVVLEKSSGSGSPGTAVAQGNARQETAQRISVATPADITGSHVTIAARSSLGRAGASRRSSIRVKPGETFVCARRKAK